MATTRLIEVEQREEECLVTNDRPAIAHRHLVRVGPVGLRRLGGAAGGRPESKRLISIVAPRVGIERRVANAPRRTAGKPVRSGTRAVLDRAVAAAEFHI